MCVLVAARSLVCLAMDLAEEGEPPFEMAGRVLSKTLRSAGNPVGVRLQVKDPELATALRRRVELAEVSFEVLERLEAAEHLLAHLERDMFPQAMQSPLEQPGMSLDRLRAFADGCAAFHHSRPWRHLHDDDVVEVESPPAPQGMRCGSILGAAGQVFGIGFYKDAKGYDRMLAAADGGKSARSGPRWALMFHAPDELPPDDAELWEEHGLRVAADESAPVLARYRGASSAERPDGKTLTFVEGLCRALASTSEAELDSGRWEMTVDTFDGPVTYRLAIPHLLERAKSGGQVAFGPAAMERAMRQMQRLIQQSGARTPEEANRVLKSSEGRRFLDESLPADATAQERATELCYQAQGQRSRRQLQLLREALRLDPDSAEAYVLLARRESDPAEAEALYRKAVEAGRRALGPAVFAEAGYPFWGAMESRPFMRAMAGLADSLESQGRLEEAADILDEMLRLNPGDNQGMRYHYVPVLIALGRLEQARAVLESAPYRHDGCALWAFAAALVASKEGRIAAADAALKTGMKRNRFVAPLILDPDLLPTESCPTWSPGAETEGVMVAELLGDIWRSDPRAVRWLRDASARPAARSRPAKPRKRKPQG